MLTSTDIIRASQNGISEGALRRRLNIGWDKDRAMAEPIHARQKELSKWLSIAAENGITKRNFENRLHNLGWTEEWAATKPVRAKRRSIS